MLGLNRVSTLPVLYNKALFIVIKETFSFELSLILLLDSGPLLL